MKAVISDIKRFATHDGDGIRTTVFFKGCPLRCVWCHNPEGIDFKPQLAFYKDKCRSCLECSTVCKQSAHIFDGQKHIFLRDKCTLCTQCESVCLASALKFYGRHVTVDEAFSAVMEDKDFYVTSGGGVTLSGGECLCQAEFCGELLKRLKSEGINTAVDTSGFVSRQAIDTVLPYTDTFLYDIKAMDEAVHIKCTGQSNKIILDNLKYIDSMDKRIEIRVPFVPNCNDGEIEKISAFVKSLKNIVRTRVLAYHNYAGSKYCALDMENTLPAVLPAKEQVEKAQSCFL